jgi:NitT/TauT family transport system ATP-binding protein
MRGNDLQPKLRFRGVSLTYRTRRGPIEVLDDVDLEIQTGEFVTIVGPTGCGKTTLLNIAGGLIFPVRGQATVDGAPISGPGPDRGMIFQQYALFPWLTARGNVEFGLGLRKIPGPERRRLAMKYLELVGLAEFAEALPKELSGGMKQRCAIARAYALNPSLLLMDEPFAAVDALTRLELQEQLLATWEQERTTILFVTHDVDEAVFLANRVVVMSRGPGRIKEVVNVDLPYPRRDALRISPEFGVIRNQIWRAVHEQRASSFDLSASVAQGDPNA